MVKARKYIDQRGWKYKVMRGIVDDTFKARYQKPEKSGSTGWKGVASLPWRSTFEEAQADLDRMARKKGWQTYISGGPEDCALSEHCDGCSFPKCPDYLSMADYGEELKE
ncbi:MAG: hypothetical protein IJT94_06070 [Oscillibacter sp.]|nr:hypothetical protein [Oscillibacter sp.]